MSLRNFSCQAYSGWAVKNSEAVKSRPQGCPILAQSLSSAASAAVVTVLGGPHATFDAQDILAGQGHIDFIVRREGELTFVELLESLGSPASMAALPGSSGMVWVGPPLSLSDPSRIVLATGP